VTCKAGTELYSSSSASFSDLERLRSDFRIVTGVAATFWMGSLVGKILCLTLYPSVTATGQFIRVAGNSHFRLQVSMNSLPKREDVYRRRLQRGGNVHFHSDVDEVSLDQFWNCWAGDVVRRQRMALPLLATYNMSFRHPFRSSKCSFSNALCKTSGTEDSAAKCGSGQGVEREK
jgi:hypothetical protein